MSLRDDIDAMERHSKNGTLREYFEGTAPTLHEETPLDRSARPNQSMAEWLRNRGE